MIRFARRKPAPVQSRARLRPSRVPRDALASTGTHRVDTPVTADEAHEANAEVLDEVRDPIEASESESVLAEASESESVLAEASESESALFEPEGRQLTLPEAEYDESTPVTDFGSEEERFFSEPESDAYEARWSAPQEPGPSTTLAPTVLDVEPPDTSAAPDARAVDPESDLLRARRLRLRRAVVGALSVSAALLLLGIGLRRADGFRFSQSNAARAPVARLTPTVPPKAVPSSPPSNLALAPEPLVPEPLTGGAAEAKSSDARSEQGARQLIQAARSLLEAGQIRAGVAAARQALAANSSDAEPYILLAAGLQDLGDWAGARSVFAACKEQTHRGPNADCRYFLSRTH